MLKFEILLSSMYEKDFSIIEASNISSPTIIINQCDKLETNIYRNDIKMYDVNERGLSKSRNLAIKKSLADICLIADNDECFFDDMESKIKDAYIKYPEADIIIFELENRKKNLSSKPKKLKYFDLLKVSSWQITFKRESIVKNKIYFDILLGAGTGNGAGEENKFLMDCYKKRLKIYYVPISIGYLRNGNESTWFKGYDKEYFYQRGKSTRYYLGCVFSSLYALYFIITKSSLYIDTIDRKQALYYIFRGIYSKKLGD